MKGCRYTFESRDRSWFHCCLDDDEQGFTVENAPEAMRV